MSAQTAGNILVLLIVLAIVAAIAGYLLHWFYRRASPQMAFVRTGLGGRKVVVDGGAIVIPIVHSATPVNMNTLRLEVQRAREQALITKDRMRVDATAEFYVRVAPSEQGIAAAAQTLGTRTMEPQALIELVEGRFVDALRRVAAEMTMEELHGQRGLFAERTRASVADELLRNGLELESVSITQLDQTAMEFFNPSNVFDAEGLTRLTEEIERRKKLRNDIEQDTLIQIRNKNLEAERLGLDIERDSENARLTQEREIEIARATQRAELARERARKDRESQEAEIESRLEIERARIASERALDEARIGRERETERLEIARRRELEIAEQERSIAIAVKSKEQSVAQAEADAARALAVAAEEKVFSSRELEIAERRKEIALLAAREDAERESIRMRLAAEAEKAVATDRAEAMRIVAVGEADAEKVRAVAAKIRHEVEAEAARMMNEAQNLLSAESRISNIRLRLVEKMDSIIRESVKPLEKIEGIRIFQVDGLGSGPAAQGEGGNVTDNVVNSALRYRAQAPLVDYLLREIGIQGGDVKGFADGLIQARRQDLSGERKQVKGPAGRPSEGKES